MTEKLIEDAFEDKKSPKAPNYIVWIVGTMLAVAGIVLVKNLWREKGRGNKAKVYKDAGNFLQDRRTKIRKTR